LYQHIAKPQVAINIFVGYFVNTRSVMWQKLKQGNEKAKRRDIIELIGVIMHQSGQQRHI